MSVPLPLRWQAKPDESDSIRLSQTARDIVASCIQDLATSDRVAGDTPIRALAVHEQGVHAVLACPRDVLNQRIGRLKSRTATVLSFNPAIGVGGKSTWSRGFWWARLTDEAMVSRVETYVNGESADPASPAFSSSGKAERV